MRTDPVNSVLVARLDSVGDVLLTGPAIRAVAASGRRIVALCGHRGIDAARLLPGVDELIGWTAPWIDPEPRPVSSRHTDWLVEQVARRRVDEAVVFTSFHQSALPLALLLRLAGVQRISAISQDFPGSLLDVRHQVEAAIPEAERALSLARAAGFALPAGDDGRLRLRPDLPDPSAVLPGQTPYVVVHPGTSVPARAWPAGHFARLVPLLAQAGWLPVVTGTAAEAELVREVAGPVGVDLAGRLSLAELAALIGGAAAIVVANTGPAHLAAAVGTPVVSLFAPTVPVSAWQPYRVPHIVLGDQAAPCRGSRARVCPLAGHPCLSGVSSAEVLAAVESLVAITHRPRAAEMPGVPT
jgi:ADP-heptose:LPS heptosyltransferase